MTILFFLSKEKLSTAVNSYISKLYMGDNWIDWLEYNSIKVIIELHALCARTTV